MSTPCGEATGNAKQGGDFRRPPERRGPIRGPLPPVKGGWRRDYNQPPLAFGFHLRENLPPPSVFFLPVRDLGEN